MAVKLENEMDKLLSENPWMDYGFIVQDRNKTRHNPSIEFRCFVVYGRMVCCVLMRNGNDFRLRILDQDEDGVVSLTSYLRMVREERERLCPLIPPAFLEDAESLLRHRYEELIRLAETAFKEFNKIQIMEELPTTLFFDPFQESQRAQIRARLQKQCCPIINMGGIVPQNQALPLAKTVFAEPDS